MQGKKKYEGKIYYNINLDSMVPEDHLLKRLDKLVSFDFVRDKTRVITLIQESPLLIL